MQGGAIRVGGLAASAVLAVTLSGCGAGVGPLSANTAGGGSATLEHSARHPWLATSGGPTLCVPKKGQQIRLDSIRPWGVTGGAKVVKAWVHTVSPRDWRSALRHRRAKNAVLDIGSIPGAPPRWNQPYADLRPVGSYRPIKGYTTSETCAQMNAAHADMTPLKIPQAAWVELEVVVRFRGGPDGGHVNGYTIDYTSGGNRYRLPIPLDLGGCRHVRAESMGCKRN